MKITLKELMFLDSKGSTVEFEINSHPRIPNTVIVNGCVYGDVTMSTYRAYIKKATK